MDFTTKIKDVINYYKFILPQKGKNKDYSKKIISVFTNPRSGSTWLTDIIKQGTLSTVIWEPLFIYNEYKINRLNPFAYPEIHKVGFAWNQPIPENENWLEAEHFFHQLFKQEIVNLKLYRFNNYKELAKSNTLLFKFCFGNLLLPWIVENFEINPILFVRHPAAVVLSQLKRWGYVSNRKKYNIGIFRYNDIYLKYKHVFDKVNSPEEYLAAEWALTNVYPIKHKYNNKKWLTVAYENIITNPEYELKRISEAVGVNFPNAVIDNIKRPSFTTDDTSGFHQDNQLYKWQKELSKVQIDKILNIIHGFGVDFYGEGIMPNNKIIYNL